VVRRDEFAKGRHLCHEEAVALVSRGALTHTRCNSILLSRSPHASAIARDTSAKTPPRQNRFPIEAVNDSPTQSLNRSLVPAWMALCWRSGTRPTSMQSPPRR
jgi:hypothetical protein